MKIETTVPIPEKRRGPRRMVSGPALPRPARLEWFEQIVVPHLNAAYNLARWLMRNDDDAQDAVQEASLRAYRFFDGYRGGDPKSWLLAIVRNTCMTWRRRTQRGLSTVVFDETVHGAAHESSAEELLVDAGRRSALRDCIEGLPVDYREVLILREFEEMSYKQIAETAGLPIGTVMSRLARARQRLEECVSGRRRAAGV